MLADVPLVARLPLGHASDVRVRHSDVGVFVVNVRVAVVPVVVLLPPHIAASTTKIIQRGAKDRTDVLVVAHRAVVCVVLNGDSYKRHAASPGNGREEAQGERGRRGYEGEVPVR